MDKEPLLLQKQKRFMAVCLTLLYNYDIWSNWCNEPTPSLFIPVWKSFD